MNFILSRMAPYKYNYECDMTLVVDTVLTMDPPVVAAADFPTSVELASKQALIKENNGRGHHQFISVRCIVLWLCLRLLQLCASFISWRCTATFQASIACARGTAAVRVDRTALRHCTEHHNTDTDKDENNHAWNSIFRSCHQIMRSINISISLYKHKVVALDNEKKYWY